MVFRFNSASPWRSLAFQMSECAWVVPRLVLWSVPGHTPWATLISRLRCCWLTVESNTATCDSFRIISISCFENSVAPDNLPSHIYVSKESKNYSVGCMTLDWRILAFKDSLKLFVQRRFARCRKKMPMKMNPVWHRLQDVNCGF